MPGSTRSLAASPAVLRQPLLLGLYLGTVIEAGAYSPHLIRFLDYPGPAELPPLATMPQDSALLLMLDEGSRASRASGGGPGIVLPEFVTPVIIGIGFALTVLGPAWYWLGKPAYFRNTRRRKQS